MILSELPIREPDDFGQGHYNAPRSNSLGRHTGVDFACYPDTSILAPVTGMVTRLGICYNDDHSYRYVEIINNGNLYYRVLYISPLVAIGDQCIQGVTVIGKAQNIAKRYNTDKKKMNNHVHFEVFDLVNAKRQYQNPLGEQNG